ncbi:MAG: zinc ribbon domain-containing protein [Candidatus Bathyarchaeia archaeon]
MLRRNLLAGVVFALVLLVLVAHDVSGQMGGSVRITQVDAPTTVAAGQTLTVTTTISYSIAPGFSGQGLMVMVLDHTGAMGNPYAITASSCEGYTYPDLSICAISPSNPNGDLTVSFTLTAPNTPAQSFNLCVYAYVTNGNSYPPQVAASDSKVVKVVTSGQVTTSSQTFPTTQAYATPTVSYTSTTPTSYSSVASVLSKGQNWFTFNNYVAYLVFLVAAGAGVVLFLIWNRAKSGSKPKSKTTPVRRVETAPKTTISKDEPVNPPSPAQAPERTRRESAMFCSQCGAQISRDSKFCKECGSKQT